MDKTINNRIKWQLKAANYSIIILLVSIILTALSCTKEEQNPCKVCKYNVRYEADSGAVYSIKEEVKEECINTSDDVSRDYGTFEFEHPLIQDSIIAINGTRVTIKKCK